MPAINEGDTFPSLKDFKVALREWAIGNNWTPHILDSDSHRVRAGCRSSKDCPFRIRANFSDKRRNALVTTCDDVHNCYSSRSDGAAAHQNIKRAETGKLRFLLEAVPKLMTVTLDTNVQEIVDAVEKKHGQRIPTRQAQKVKTGLAPRVRGPCRHCQQIGHTRRHCPQLKGIINGPQDFSIDDTMDMTGADQGSDAGTYADGGPEHDYGNGGAMDADRDHDGQRQQPPKRGRPRTQQNSAAIDPSLSNGFETVRVIHQSYPALENSQQTPQSNQLARSATSAPNKNPAEVRMEAARLMQSAAKLMEQAAKMNAEAAALNLSVAHA